MVGLVEMKKFTSACPPRGCVYYVRISRGQTFQILRLPEDLPSPEFQNPKFSRDLCKLAQASAD